MLFESFFTQFCYFLLSYADKLLIIHQLILQFFKDHLPIAEYELTGFTIVEYVEMFHILFLNALHFYLIYALFNTKKISTLTFFQIIAMIISAIDWFSMDIMMILESRPQYPWFRMASAALFFLHFLPLTYLAQYKRRSENNLPVSHSIKY